MVSGQKKTGGFGETVASVDATERAPGLLRWPSSEWTGMGFLKRTAATALAGDMAPKVVAK